MAATKQYPNPGDVISEQKYTVKCPEGNVYTYTMTLERSGAFAYGNETCMTLKCEENGKQCNMNQYYDTRYCKGIGTNGEGFEDWSMEWLRNYIRPDCTIERA